MGIAVCAALIDAYPFGGSRHGFYLGPIVFLAAGGAFHLVGVEAGELLRRAWLAPALGVAAAVAIAAGGAAAIYQYRHYLYYSDPSAKQVLEALAGLEREGDVVYVSRWEVPSVEFHRREEPASYFYGEVVCWGRSWGECAPEMLDEMFGAAVGSRRIWLVHNASVSVSEALAAHSGGAAGVEVEEVGGVGGRDAFRARGHVEGLPKPHYDRQVDRLIRLRNDNSWPKPHTTLHLITGFDEITAGIREEWLDMHDAVAAEAPSAVGAYNLYARDGALYYAKRPCAAADTEAKFFLHVYPTDAAELPDRGGGLENLDFDFRAYGFLADDRCIIRRELPNYSVERIHTGQFIYPDGPVVWEAELAVER